ncbi:MAG TPA: hypothetical protein PKW29_10825 [Clostridia bacterium]|nr:hypothetical protein [Clostridia bacterium]
MIAQKLDLLMKVTNTQNSTLGRVLSFDPSYIGRIRAGKRGLPKHQSFIEPAAVFFARNIREAYQKNTLADAICPGRPWPEDTEEAKSLLISWLCRGVNKDNDPVGKILTGLSSLSTKSPPLPKVIHSEAVQTQDKAVFYYGNAGKRSAVETFLGELSALGVPVTLLLYSDEDMDWLYEDAAFAKRWSALLMDLISNGSRIKIIHTVNRGIGEMLEAVQKWLPLYAGGAIEPFYYPKIRDGVYHRTLFIASGHSAIVSNSVGSHTQEALNILIHDIGAINALEAEFKDYFSLCKPLMQIFNMRNNDLFWKMLSTFEKGGGNMIAALPGPSYFTMPETVALSMASRCQSKWLLKRQRDATARFKQHLAQDYTMTEILRLPAPEAVLAGAVSVPLCDMLSQPTLCYTAEEFKKHLHNTLDLLNMVPGYNLILSDKTMDNVILCVKEDTGAIMLRATPPTTVFGISEQSMTAAFWEYLQRQTGKTFSKEKSIQQLKSYINKI